MTAKTSNISETSTGANTGETHGTGIKNSMSQSIIEAGKSRVSLSQM